MHRFMSWLMAALVVGIGAYFLLPRLLHWAVLPDFSMWWTAARDWRHAYDADALTREQAWLVNPSMGPRPFPYPPSALLLFLPFGLLPFWLAYWAWVCLSAGLFWTAARRIARGWAAALAMASPHVVLVLILGQTTLVVGAAIIWGLSLLRKKPLLAGMLLGVAAAIKPQSVVLAPVALVSGRHWESIRGAAIGFAGAALVSLLAFGPGMWAAWLKALAVFPAIVERNHSYLFGATPLMMGRTLQFSPTVLGLLQAAGIVLGCIAVWRAFQSNDLAERLAAFVGGCLLASPYGMRYEIAMMAPALAIFLLSGTARGQVRALLFFAFYSFTAVPLILLNLALSRRQDGLAAPGAAEGAATQSVWAKY